MPGFARYFFDSKNQKALFIFDTIVSLRRNRGKQMGLFSGLLGNASQKDNNKVEEQLRDVLVPGEQVELAFALIRDLIVFTEKRLILVDKQGMTGKKTSYKSIPYRSISRFTVETSGHFDLDAELKIWISSAMEPAEILQFKSDKNIVQIQQALAAAVLK